MNKCIPVFLLLFLFSCQEENILVVEENSDHSPTVITTGKGSFKYSLNAEVLLDNQGFGAVTQDIYYTISSGEVVCLDSTGTSGFLSPEKGSYAVFLLGDTKESMIANFGILYSEVDGETELIFLTSCEEQDISVQVDSLSADFISGRVNGNGFRVIDDQATSCDQYEDIGEVEIEFAVPLNNCQ